MPAALSLSVDPLELDTAPAMRSALRGEFVDEEVHRRSGADAEHLSFDHEFQRCARRSLFSSVLRTHCDHSEYSGP